MEAHLHKKAHILIIDDEEAIRDMVEFSLEKYQIRVKGAADCAAADAFLAKQHPDLILLDWMLPEQSGVEYAKQLHSQPSTKDIPIIMLTAKAEEKDKVRGLDEAQADDYVTKPFSPRELAARIRAVLRRTPGAEATPGFADLHIDFDNRSVRIGGEAVSLTAKQFNLLHFFSTHSDKVHTRQQLVDGLATHGEVIDERSIDRQLKRLRDALKPYAYDTHLQTVRGHGYKLVTKL